MHIEKSFATVYKTAQLQDIFVGQGIKRALGPVRNKTVPLKEPDGIIDGDRQMSRWVEHCTTLYSHSHPEAVNKRFELGEELSIEEFHLAVNSVVRVPIPAELKCVTQDMGDANIRVF